MVHVGAGNGEGDELMAMFKVRAFRPANGSPAGIIELWQKEHPWLPFEWRLTTQWFGYSGGWVRL